MSKESDKSAVRSMLRSALKSLLPQEVTEKSERIAHQLSSFLNEFRLKNPQKNSFVLGVYSPMQKEVNWQIIESEVTKDWNLAFPSFCEESGMKFRSGELGIIKSLEFGALLKVPNPEAQVLVPDICLIPGLGFSKKGERLGRGKGFYDRFLSDFGGLKVGLCFKEQILEVVPTEAHDVLLDFLIDESCIYHSGEPYKVRLSAEDI